MTIRVFKNGSTLTKSLARYGKYAFLFFLLKGIAWAAGVAYVTWYYSQ